MAKEENEKLERIGIRFAPSKKKVDSTSCNSVVKKMRSEMKTLFYISISVSTGCQEEICFGIKKQFSVDMLPHSECIKLLKEQM